MRNPFSALKLNALSRTRSSLFIGIFIGFCWATASASSGYAFADSVASFFGLSKETVQPERVAPFASGTCDIGNNIEVEATGGTDAGYATLTAAFTAINAGAHTGTITIDVCGDTSEGT